MYTNDVLDIGAWLHLFSECFHEDRPTQVRDISALWEETMVVGFGGLQEVCGPECAKCPVCSEEDGASWVMPPCGHRFHVGCLTKAGDAHCPVCRVEYRKLESQIETVQMFDTSSGSFISTRYIMHVRLRGGSGHMEYRVVCDLQVRPTEWDGLPVWYLVSMDIVSEGKRVETLFTGSLELTDITPYNLVDISISQNVRHESRFILPLALSPHLSLSQQTATGQA